MSYKKQPKYVVVGSREKPGKYRIVDTSEQEEGNAKPKESKKSKKSKKPQDITTKEDFNTKEEAQKEADRLNQEAK